VSGQPRNATEPPPLWFAVAGKGGAGKSVLTGTLARVLARRGHRVLALDSDPMPGLASSLGIADPKRPLLLDAAEKPEGQRWRLKPGIGPARAVQRFTSRAPDGVRLLQLGKAGTDGLASIQGSVNAFLHVVHRLPEAPSLREWTIVGDLPAGPRHPAGGFAPYAKLFVVLVEARSQSALTARRVARIVRALERSGELENTLILFTSDNGYFQGEHRIKGGKIRLYEEATRVPLLMRGPGVPRGRRVGELVANIDLASTVAAVAHARPGRVLDGRSLLSVAARPVGYPSRDILFENGPQDGRARRLPRYTAIRTARYVYAEHETGERELYDLRRDPHQLRSRHASPAYAAVRAELARRLERLRRCAGASCR